MESELAAGNGFGVKDKDTKFRWPRGDETVDVDFIARLRISTLSMEAETSDDEDDLNTEFAIAVEDEDNHERKTDSLSPGINPLGTEYQVESENIIVSMIVIWKLKKTTYRPFRNYRKT